MPLSRRSLLPRPLPPGLGAGGGLDACSAPRALPDRHHPRPGCQLPRLGRDALGLRKGQPRRRDQEVRRRSRPRVRRHGGGSTSSPSAGLRAADVIGCATSSRPGTRSATTPTTTSTSRRRRPERDPVSLSPLPLADRGQAAGRGDPRQHPAAYGRPADPCRHSPGRLPHARRLFDVAYATAPTSSRCFRTGLTWVSSLYPAHAVGPARQEPTEEVLRSIVAAQRNAQPFTYPRGPDRNPHESDQRHRRLPRRPLAARVVPHRDSAKFRVVHRQPRRLRFPVPSLVPVRRRSGVSPIELICDMARRVGDRAAIVDLGMIARRMQAR